MPQGNHIERIHDSYSKADTRSIIHCSCLFLYPGDMSFYNIITYSIKKSSDV